MAQAALSDPERSLEIAALLGNESIRAKREIIQRLATSDIRTAMELNEKTFADNPTAKAKGDASILAAWGATDPVAALNWASGQQGAEAKRAAIILEWASNDLRAAMEYWRRSNIPVSFDMGSAMFQRAYLIDHKAAWELYDSLEASEGKEKLLSLAAAAMGVTETTEDVEKIIDANISADGRDGKLLEIAGNIGAVSPMPEKTVMMLLNKIDPANIPLDEEQVLVKISGAFTEDPELILDWASKTGGDHLALRDTSVKMIEAALKTWNAKKPEAAAAWLDSCKALDDAEKDEIRRKLK